MHCGKCSKEIIGKDAGAHSRWCGHSKNFDRLCKVCGKTFENKDRRKTLCSDECKRVRAVNAFKDEDLRKRLSDSRKAWLAANPEKHPWKRSSKFESEPCQNLKDALEARSIEFHEEFTPLDDRFFSLDVAFPAMKIGIEVNGEQHYNRNGSLKPYYQQRHDLIESAGWKLYEVHYSICYDQKRLSSIVDSIVETHDLSGVDLTFEVRPKGIPTKKFPTRQAYADSQKLPPETLKLWRNAIDSVDTMKFGFIGKIAKKMNCSHTHARRVLNTYFPQIESFKRKSSSISQQQEETTRCVT